MTSIAHIRDNESEAFWLKNTNFGIFLCLLIPTRDLIQREQNQIQKFDQEAHRDILNFDILNMGYRKQPLCKCDKNGKSVLLADCQILACA